MPRRDWELMRRLQQVSPPEFDSQKSLARKVAREMLLDTLDGEVNFGAEIGATTAAHLLIEMRQHGNAVITTPDIYDVADIYASELSGITSPTVANEAQTWLGSLGLEELSVEYTTVDEWGEEGTIWVAPVFPTVEDISKEYGDPPVLRWDTVQYAIEDAFDEPVTEKERFYEALINVDWRELDAFHGVALSEFDEHWAPITRRDGGAWANPAQINERLLEKGERLEFDEVTAVLSEALKETPDARDWMLQGGVDAEEIGPLMQKLEEEYDWVHLTTLEDGTVWYHGEDAADDAWTEHGKQAENALKNIKDASIEELERAHRFFESNRRLLVEWENNNPRQVEAAVRKLKGQVRALREEQRLEGATIGEPDDVESTFEATTPTEYHVAKEIDEMYEEMKREREADEDDEESDKGVGYYMY